MCTTIEATHTNLKTDQMDRRHDKVIKKRDENNTPTPCWDGEHRMGGKDKLIYLTSFCLND